MGKTNKTNTDAAGKPSPQPNGVAKTSTVNRPVATASTAAAPGKVARPGAKAAPATAEKKPVERSAPAKTSKPKPAISSDDIALRAYFIAEKRRAKGLPGDEAHDWIEAERQLRAESSKPTARAKKIA